MKSGTVKHLGMPAEFQMLHVFYFENDDGSNRIEIAMSPKAFEKMKDFIANLIK